VKINRDPILQLAWHSHGIAEIAVAYNLKQSRIERSITDYAIYLSFEEVLDSKTVKNEIYLLKGFLEFLLARGTALQNVTDATLTDFKETEFLQVQKSVNSSGSEKAAQRTVNSKLKRAYHFLCWLQNKEQAIQNVIGSANYPVTSAISLSAKIGRSIKIDLSERELYPLLFRKSGKNSRRSTQYHATAADLQSLSEFFLSERNEYIGHRNILIMDLADQLSWRRASINSLTCDQFTCLDFESMDEDAFLVVPPSQKFGYLRSFEVPFRLAFRVHEFIVTARKDLLRKGGWSEAKTNGRVFISARDGKPLQDRTLSMIFGRAFKSLAKPRGANIHSLRRKAADDRVDAEIQTRLELGLDTSELSVATTVAFSMGQSNPESLTPYVTRSMGRMVRQRESIKNRQLRAMEEEVARLRNELAILERDKKGS
jgi:hypothetical protein